MRAGCTVQPRSQASINARARGPARGRASSAGHGQHRPSKSVPPVTFREEHAALGADPGAKQRGSKFPCLPACPHLFSRLEKFLALVRISPAARAAALRLSAARAGGRDRRTGAGRGTRAEHVLRLNFPLCREARTPPCSHPLLLSGLEELIGRLLWTS